ncbi:hypothetical protein QE374_001840 [Microbacterium sp. SORGH_AS428]|uniref:hypothetical protein n=1 Tax=Microbacterium sp. SORGH_AS_0428 TaxID=3041788 RepID=UPI00285E859D|nr:hypothetical protein [Microbacterium sp. SORGH_AS_0428]MDR6199931.1 hypothetical protein [Microbacterium sp. SORGH_AS_0428]
MEETGYIRARLSAPPGAGAAWRATLRFINGDGDAVARREVELEATRTEDVPAALHAAIAALVGDEIEMAEGLPPLTGDVVELEVPLRCRQNAS